MLLNIYKILGIKPTPNYTEVRKAYRTQLQRLNKQLSEARRNDEDNVKNIESKLLELNQAFNVISEHSIEDIYKQSVARVEVIDEEEELLRMAGVVIEHEYIPEIQNKSVSKILDMTEVKWIDKGIDSIEEIITLNDFLNPEGTLMITDDFRITIPQGFLGVMTVALDNKLQFINIRDKNSLAYFYDANGNLLLKSIPEGSYIKNNKLVVKLRNYEIEANLEEFEFNKDLKSYVGRKQGAKTYANKRGDYLIDLPALTSACGNNPLVSQIKAILEK